MCGLVRENHDRVRVYNFVLRPNKFRERYIIYTYARIIHNSSLIRLAKGRRWLTIPKRTWMMYDAWPFTSSVPSRVFFSFPVYSCCFPNTYVVVVDETKRFENHADRCVKFRVPGTVEVVKTVISSVIHSVRPFVSPTKRPTDFVKKKKTRFRKKIRYDESEIIRIERIKRMKLFLKQAAGLIRFNNNWIPPGGEMCFRASRFAGADDRRRRTRCYVVSDVTARRNGRTDRRPNDSVSAQHDVRRSLRVDYTRSTVKKRAYVINVKYQRSSIDVGGLRARNSMLTKDEVWKTTGGEIIFIFSLPLEMNENMIRFISVFRAIEKRIMPPLNISLTRVSKKRRNHFRVTFW